MPRAHDAADARVERLGDALDDAALAGGVAALEQADDLEAAGLDPLLELDQLDLEPGQLGFVVLGVELLAALLDEVAGGWVECVRGRSAMAMPILAKRVARVLEAAAAFELRRAGNGRRLRPVVQPDRLPRGPDQSTSSHGLMVLSAQKVPLGRDSERHQKARVLLPESSRIRARARGRFGSVGEALSDRPRLVAVLTSVLLVFDRFHGRGHLHLGQDLRSGRRRRRSRPLQRPRLGRGGAGSASGRLARIADRSETRSGGVCGRVCSLPGELGLLHRCRRRFWRRALCRASSSAGS
jgi:hypothetical protein